MTRLCAIPEQYDQSSVERAVTGDIRRFFVLGFAFIAVAFWVASARAQAVDSGLWLSFSATGKLPAPLNNAKGSWRLWTDGQARFGDDFGRFSQGLIRPGVGYALNDSWTVWAGYAYIRTEQP